MGLSVAFRPTHTCYRSGRNTDGPGPQSYTEAKKSNRQPAVVHGRRTYGKGAKGALIGINRSLASILDTRNTALALSKTQKRKNEMAPSSQERSGYCGLQRE